ncbi:hypothetical protein ACFL0M_08895 [Thermodesulfobacteriota bacterium]
MQAQFRNAAGQAFTDRFGDFSGKLNDVVNMPLVRAVFVAALNAVLRHLNKAWGTIH